MKILNKLIILSAMTSTVFGASHQDLGNAAGGRTVLASPRLTAMEAALAKRQAAFEDCAPVSGRGGKPVLAASSAAPAPLASPRLMLPAEVALLARQAAFEDCAPVSGRGGKPVLAASSAAAPALASPRLTAMEAALAKRQAAFEDCAPVSGRGGKPVLAASSAVPAPLASPRLMLPAEAALAKRQAALEDRAPSGCEVALVAASAAEMSFDEKEAAIAALQARKAAMLERMPPEVSAERLKMLTALNPEGGHASVAPAAATGAGGGAASLLRPSAPAKGDSDRSVGGITVTDSVGSAGSPVASAGAKPATDSAVKRDMIEGWLSDHGVSECGASGASKPSHS